MAPRSQVKLPENDAEFIDELLAFMDQEIVPIQEALGETFTNPRLYWREDGRLADEVVAARRQARMRSAEAGFFAAFCPQDLGGEGRSARLHFEAVEAMVHRYGAPLHQLPMSAGLAHIGIGPTGIWRHTTDSLKPEIVPALARGEVQGAFAMSEPQAGSDVWSMSTRAVRDGDEWILDGTKQWATWGPTAEFLLTFAITDPETFGARRGGITCFYVPTATPGYRLESIIPILGELGGEECIISFTGMRIPDRYRVGPVDQGFAVAMEGSDELKTTKMARTTGLARWAQDRATAYARERRTFGKTLSEHQTVQNMLAASAIDLYTCKLMGLDISARIDAGEDLRGRMAMADAFAYEAAYRVIDRAMQVFGGRGVTNEEQLYSAWHVTRVARLSEGPTEIQMRSVANALLKGRIDL